jgi:hypothetical protein
MLPDLARVFPHNELLMVFDGRAAGCSTVRANSRGIPWIEERSLFYILSRAGPIVNESYPGHESYPGKIVLAYLNTHEIIITM